jgi:hypothetical protein
MFRHFKTQKLRQGNDEIKSEEFEKGIILQI